MMITELPKVYSNEIWVMMDELDNNNEGLELKQLYFLTFCGDRYDDIKSFSTPKSPKYFIDKVVEEEQFKYVVLTEDKSQLYTRRPPNEVKADRYFFKATKINHNWFMLYLGMVSDITYLKDFKISQTGKTAVMLVVNPENRTEIYRANLFRDKLSDWKIMGSYTGSNSDELITFEKEGEPWYGIEVYDDQGNKKRHDLVSEENLLNMSPLEHPQSQRDKIVPFESLLKASFLIPVK